MTKNHLTEGQDVILEDEKSQNRDKCSRGFSEIQYFTKEISPNKPNLVGDFSVLA
jgi:hypothetical protein